MKIDDIIAVRCNLIPPPRPILPNGFDFARFAYFKQIGAIGYTTGKIKILECAKEIQLSEKFEGLVNKLREKIVEILSKDMDKSASAIAAGLLVGDASGNIR